MVNKTATYMPRGQSYKYARKKRYRQHAKNVNLTLGRNRLMTSHVPRSALLGNAYETKLKLTAYKRFNTGLSASSGAMSIQLNSIYDPFRTDTTLGTFQPAGFDQISTFYQFYDVKAVKAKVIWSASDAQGLKFCGERIVTGANTTIPSAPGDFREFASSQKSQIGYVSIDSGGSNVLSHKWYTSIQKALGEDHFQSVAGVGTSPTSGNQPYLQLYWESATAINTTLPVALIKLTFYVSFSGRTQLPNSSTP